MVARKSVDDVSYESRGGGMIALRRYYFDTHTLGVMKFPDRLIYTIERPWMEHPDFRGGVPFKSCVPEGLYTLSRFKSSTGKDLWSIENKDLGVYVKMQDRELLTDRYACLIHAGNSVRDVVGCIAPGTGAGLASVTSSRIAMGYLDRALSTHNTILIKAAE